MASQHLAIRVLIEDTLRSVDDSVLFVYARKSDWDSLKKNNDKRCQLDLLKQTISFSDDGSSNYSKVYQVIMGFYKLDNIQGAEAETAVILDEMDLLSDQFINKLNVFSMNEEVINQDTLYTQVIEIGNIQKQPFVKINDAASGYAISFNLTAPDTFDYCSLYE